MDDIEIATLDELEATHWWYRARKWYLTKWVSKFPLDARILDLGSASGGNTIFVQSLGYSVVSVEYSKLGVGLQLKKGINAIRADARNLPFESGSFDGVYCLDVLEHIEEDVAVLGEIQRILKPGGVALLSVPQDPQMWSEHDTAVNHVRRYKKRELECKSIDAGLICLNRFSSVVTLKPAIKFARKFTKGSNLKPVSKAYDWLFYLFCLVDRLPVFRSCFGTTGWLVVNKPNS